MTKPKKKHRHMYDKCGRCKDFRGRRLKATKKCDDGMTHFYCLCGKRKP